MDLRGLRERITTFTSTKRKRKNWGKSGSLIGGLVGVYVVVFLLLVWVGFSNQMSISVPAFSNGIITATQESLKEDKNIGQRILETQIPLMSEVSEIANPVITEDEVFDNNKPVVNPKVNLTALLSWELPLFGEICGTEEAKASALAVRATVEEVINDESLPPAINPGRYVASSSGQVGIAGTNGGVDIIIYHTHATESFVPTSGAAFSYNPEENMIAVGIELKRTLEKRGYTVIHNTTMHDADGRLGAYVEAATTLDALTSRYPNAKLLLDIHRDALVREKSIAQAAGLTCAKVLFVVGTDHLLDHKNWRVNEALATELNRGLVLSYPELSRGLLFSDNRYNQHYSKGAALIEVGSQSVTLEEAIRTANIMGDIIADFLSEQY